MVTNANDSGPGSLREAITESNATLSSGNTIDVPGRPGSGLVTIAPQSPLPPITVPVVLNGESQPGFARGTPIVVLDGRSIPAGELANGLTIFAGNSTVQGLVIDGFGGAGIELEVVREQRHPGRLHRRRCDRGPGRGKQRRRSADRRLAR